MVQQMDGLERRQVGLSAIIVAELEFGVAANKRQGCRKHQFSLTLEPAYSGLYGYLYWLN
jgi:hypothetical protein